LAALVPCGLVASVAAGCGGSTDSDGKGSGGAGGGTSGSGGSGGAVSGGSGGVMTGGSGGVMTGGSAGMTAGTGGGSAGAPTCEYGTPTEQCFTLDELEAQINYPGPWGGDAAEDAGTDAWIEVTDCLPREQVIDGCCNSASYGPQKQGELCCYAFCPGACCGRAFVIDGQARLAPSVRRGDWLLDSDPQRDELDAVTRNALAAAWRRDARMEHASVASFARFTLELLGCAAPPELVADAQRAALDEIEHARLCFSLAARFAGEPLGPGALDVGGSELSRSLAECAVAAFNEGCIGETIAALSAREQLRHARDFEVEAALTRIAEDEERHAELAWRFVAWAVQHGGQQVRVALEWAVAAALAAPRASSSEEQSRGVDARAWRRLGRLTDSEQATIERTAIADVVLPCARALLRAEEAPLQAAV
jgi:hypothetical protein